VGAPARALLARLASTLRGAPMPKEDLPASAAVRLSTPAGVAGSARQLGERDTSQADATAAKDGGDHGGG
jgi:hypothetical protein